MLIITYMLPDVYKKPCNRMKNSVVAKVKTSGVRYIRTYDCN